MTRTYVWRPDGSGIALAVIVEPAQSHSQMLFVSVADAAIQLRVPVAPAELLGEPLVGPWSPSGMRLLFALATSRFRSAVA